MLHSLIKKLGNNVKKTVAEPAQYTHTHIYINIIIFLNIEPLHEFLKDIKGIKKSLQLLGLGVAWPLFVPW